ncbi:MAG: ribonuclease D [Desulfobacterales bacterium GWB2_56_26]|nr:MAG: ribonuclease D [Desulfobacterales bacterium GWB2_56_26]
METLNTLIQNEAELEILVRRAKQTDAVALDTEFVWERTYYPQLGLIQLALSDEECFLIDPLAIQNLQPLGQLLSDRGVVKILHDAPQDLAILQRATGATPQNIFDTRLAAGFSNLPATLSLGNLVKELLDIDLAKDETRTNWLQRPLSDEQVRYALDDVRYLRAVRVLLLSRIIGPKIKSWLQEDLNLLNNPATYSGAPVDERYLKIRNCTSLDRAGLAILMNLSIWRDGVAKKLDRPRGHIIKDPAMIEIARKKPRSTDELRHGIEISDKAVSRYGDNIIAIINTTLQQPEDSFPNLQRHTRLSSSEQAAMEKLNNLIQLKAGLLGIAPGLVGNASELKLLVKMLNSGKSHQPRQLRQTEGWRKCFLEDFFRQSRKY